MNEISCITNEITLSSNKEKLSLLSISKNTDKNGFKSPSSSSSSSSPSSNMMIDENNVRVFLLLFCFFACLNACLVYDFINSFFFFLYVF
jgi:hypothetical protein